MWRSASLKFLPRLQPKQLAILEACLIGLISGLAAVLLKQGVGLLGAERLQFASQNPTWWSLPLFGWIGGLLAGWLIERAAPEASGSGIPQVKAALGGVAIALNARVALVKLLSTLLSLGAGLTLGRQGPTVQIGAAIAAQLSLWVPTSPEHRRQLIAAGAAAGLAAGFNAPIAGVLFVVEELLQDVSGITLGTAILASFVGAVVSRLLGGQDHLILPSHTTFNAADIPVFLILGISAGILGALFSRGILFSLKFNRRIIKRSLPWRISLAGLVSGCVVAALPAALRSSASLQEVWITSELGWQLIAVIFIAKFILTLLAFGSGAPGGLFAPSLILGSTLGYLISSGVLAVQSLAGFASSIDFGEGLVTTAALTGMGAFFSAVTRGPITAIVIVFEMTADFNMVLPLMIGSVTAYLVAESLYSGSIYKHLLASNGIHIEVKAPLESRLTGLTAEDIMQRRVETLAGELSLDEAIQAFARSHHRGFPVVDEGMLVGIVTQTDLAFIQERQLSGNMPLHTIMTPRPVTVKPTAPLTQVLYLLNRHKISRLPVIDRRKLVGIITRADIIRAEADQLSGETAETGPLPEPSYVVYQTRAPEIGRGRVLVPIANPQTADALLQMAAAIAHDRQFELECLQVILVPRHQVPAETPVSTTISRKLLKRANRLEKEWQIPVHTQVRVTHDIAYAILETLKERRIDLVLMGWKGTTTTPGRIFGSVVDTIIRQASCQVILVKWEQGPGKWMPERWLVPTAGGPNSAQAIQLLPALVKLSKNPEIYLCQIHQTIKTTESPVLENALAVLSSRVKASIELMPFLSDSVPEAVIKLAQSNRCDVIVLGATREGLLQQVIYGNIPEEISRRCDCPVILVRSAIS